MLKTFNLSQISDSRGSLVFMESNKEIPFKIKRVYYLFKNNILSSRGYHAHKNLEQVAICINGSCKITLDDGQLRETVFLEDPSMGLYIGNSIWREIHDFSNDCVLLVLASEYYDENDYIRSYEDFLKRKIDEKK